MNRVLVTGAGGFIGRHLTMALSAAGHEVVAVGRTAGEPETGVRWLEADLLLPGEPERVVAEAETDSLVHLAWIATPGEFWASPENDRWTAASLALLAAFEANGGRRAVITGTCAEYDWNSPAPFSELSSPIRPATPYGWAKADLLKALMDRARSSRCGVVWARLYFPYGPGEPPGRLVPDVACRLLQGRPIATTTGRQRRDFIHVDDVVAALIQLIWTDFTGPVNVGTGRAVTVARVVELIGAMTGRSELVEVGGRPDREGDPVEVVADVALLTSVLAGWSPQPLEEGIHTTVAWWRQQLASGHRGSGRPIW